MKTIKIIAAALAITAIAVWTLASWGLVSEITLPAIAACWKWGNA